MKILLSMYNDKEVYEINSQNNDQTLNDMLILIKRLLLCAGYKIESDELIICKNYNQVVKSDVQNAEGLEVELY